MRSRLLAESADEQTAQEGDDVQSTVLAQELEKPEERFADIDIHWAGSVFSGVPGVEEQASAAREQDKITLGLQREYLDDRERDASQHDLHVALRATFTEDPLPSSVGRAPLAQWVATLTFSMKAPLQHPYNQAALCEQIPELQMALARETRLHMEERQQLQDRQLAVERALRVAREAYPQGPFSLHLFGLFGLVLCCRSF